MSRRGLVVAGASLVALGAALVVGSCKGVPTVAPTGAVVTIFANPLEIPAGGSSRVTVGVFEATGQPVPDGTVVTLSTTNGALEPSSLETRGGFAEAVFSAGTAAGDAVITASSGLATPGSVTLSIGGTVENIEVVASPTVLPVGGGMVDLTATVLSGLGSPISGERVTFATDRGTLAASGVPVVTDASGRARDTLTTDADTLVTVALLGSTATDEVRIDVVGTGATVINLTADRSTSEPLPAGERATFRLEAEALDDRGQAVANLPLSFKTDAGELASTGLVFTNGAGIATNELKTDRRTTVTARAAGASGSVTVNVDPIVVVRVDLAVEPIEVIAGTPTGSDCNGGGGLELTLEAQVVFDLPPATTDLPPVFVEFFSEPAAVPAVFGSFCTFPPRVMTDDEGLATIRYALSSAELGSCRAIATPCPPIPPATANVCPPAGSGQTAVNRCCCGLIFSARVAGKVDSLQVKVHAERTTGGTRDGCACAF